MKDDKGSVTVFMTVLMPFFLAFLILVTESVIFLHDVSKETDRSYKEMDKALSNYDRDLFTRYGLLGSPENTLDEPLSENLESSILMFMDENTKLEMLDNAENILNEFTSLDLGKVKLNFFGIYELNNDLRDVLSGRVGTGGAINLIAKITAMKPYIELKGISITGLISMLEEYDIEGIRSVSPRFILKRSISKKANGMLDAIRKYDIIGTYDKFLLSSYSVRYMGYSNTSAVSPNLPSEYILTGIKNDLARDYAVRAEIYSLRMAINFLETMTNPRVRSKLLNASGGDPGIFTLMAISVAASEAATDLYKLMNMGAIPLYKGRAGFKVMGEGRYKGGLYYRDYLMIMLMAVSREKMLDRIETSIEDDLEIDLEELFTHASFKKAISRKSLILSKTYTKEAEGELDYIRERIPVD